MTPAALLTYLLQQGAVVGIDGYDITIESAPGAITPALREALRSCKPAILRLLDFAGQYRDALTTGNRVDSLIDEIGPALAQAVRWAVMGGDTAVTR
jgi:TubC N-terminal docking domain